MIERLKKSDLELLKTLADCGVLTTAQVTMQHYGSKKVLRRRLSQLMEAGLIAEQEKGFGRAVGHPEKIFSVSEDGARLLAKHGVLPAGVSAEQVLGKSAHCVDHQMLVNWFRIHLREVERILPRLSVNFHAPASPFVPRGESGASLLQIHLAAEGENTKGVFLVPDAVFRITDSVQNKSVLFFLEVDMGTESLADPKRGAKDVRQKILNYQALFRSEKYKIFGGLWNWDFIGFRTLFLANSQERMAALCRLVVEMRPSNFIWVTDQERMFRQGLGDAIWARGGNMMKPAQSILGPTMVRPSPVPPVLP